MEKLYLRVVLILAISILSKSTLIANYLYGYNNNHIVKVNAETGERSNVSVDLPHSSWTDENHTIDAVNRKYFHSSGSNLFIVDLDSGNYSIVDIGANLYSMEYDPLANNLYGFNENRIIKVNANTFERVNVSVVLPHSSWTDENHTLDPVNDRYFHSRGSDLFTIDLKTGEYSLTDIGSNLYSMEYDPIKDCLYGYNDNHIIQVDPESGDRIIISEILPHSSWTDENHTLDPEKSRYFHSRGSDLFTIDLITGEYEMIDIGSNLYSMQYDYAVPEPATCLLFIGALPFLRRRKL